MRAPARTRRTLHRPSIGSSEELSCRPRIATGLGAQHHRRSVFVRSRSQDERGCLRRWRPRRPRWLRAEHQCAHHLRSRSVVAGGHRRRFASGIPLSDRPCRRRGTCRPPATRPHPFPTRVVQSRGRRFPVAILRNRRALAPSPHEGCRRGEPAALRRRASPWDHQLAHRPCGRRARARGVGTSATTSPDRRPARSAGFRTHDHERPPQRDSRLASALVRHRQNVPFSTPVHSACTRAARSSRETNRAVIEQEARTSHPSPRGSPASASAQTNILTAPYGVCSPRRRARPEP
jgi:hypothetical protein